MQNETCRHLANKPVEDSEFVGITERFDESVRQFCRTFGFRRVASMPRENVNPDRTAEFYGLAPGTLTPSSSAMGRISRGTSAHRSALQHPVPTRR